MALRVLPSSLLRKSSTDYYLAKGASIPPGGSLELIQGGSKVVLASGDVKIEGIRHPIIERVNDKEAYVKNNVSLNKKKPTQVTNYEQKQIMNFLILSLYFLYRI